MKCAYHSYFQMHVYSVYLESSWENRGGKDERELSVFKSFRERFNIWKSIELHGKLGPNFFNLCPYFLPTQSLFQLMWSVYCSIKCVALFQCVSSFSSFFCPMLKTYHLMPKANTTIPWNPLWVQSKCLQIIMHLFIIFLKSLFISL